MPAAHPLFRKRTLPEILEDFVLDKLAARDHIIEQLSEAGLDGQSRHKLMKALETIDQLLGRVETAGSGDPLVDFWEAQMEAGEEPDMDMTLEELKKRHG